MSNPNSEFRVDELAEQAGVSVDTIRFYQGRGLLQPPRREGRIVLYNAEHLKRLRRIRALNRDGLPLALIKRVLDEPQGDPIEGVDERLLSALAKQSVGKRLYTRRELIHEAQIPDPMITAVQGAGLIEPVRIEGKFFYNEADLQMLRAGLLMIDAGLPLARLVALATDHAKFTEEIAERAIDLFDRFIRRSRRSPIAVVEGQERAEENSEREADDALDHFHTLLPEITRLVAVHFQRTLVQRALQRYADEDQPQDLERFLAAAAAGKLEKPWT